MSGQIFVLCMLIVMTVTTYAIAFTRRTVD